MRVSFPLRLHSAANLREHWAAKARRVKRERFATKVALSNAAMRAATSAWARAFALNLEPPRLVVTLTRVAPRLLDSDNAWSAAKGVRDEIADALGIDDGDSRVAWHVEQRKGKPREYGVDVEIVALDCGVALTHTGAPSGE